MIRPNHVPLWPAAVALLLGASMARAQDSNQVDLRTDYSATNDASNLVGSEGRNAALPPYVANMANLYITGNVTTGRSFQAFSPVRDPHGFMAGMPSSTLSAFRRDSVSLDTVLSGLAPGAAAPYYSRQRTTTNLGALSAGFDAFDSWPSESIYSVPTNLPSLAGPRSGLLLPNQLPQLPLSASLEAGQLAVPLAAPSPFAQRLPTANVLGSGAASWFGVSPAAVTQEGVPRAAEEVPGLVWSREGTETLPRFDAVANPEVFDLWLRAALEAAPAAEGAEPSEGATLEGGPWLERPTETELGAEQQPQPPNVEAFVWTTPSENVPVPPEGEGAAPPPQLPRFGAAGVDLYQDMVRAYEYLAQIERLEPEARAAIVATPAAAKEYERDLDAVRHLMDGPISSFAGSGGDPVQNLIRAAEELVRTRKYYQGKMLYERAAVFDRYNPLVLIGQGHAMLAAGEYYSAALKLSQAIELFPAIVYFKFDLRNFVAEPDLLEKRRADLEVRLERLEDYRFRFLLGYAEYYSGLPKFGLPNLKRAAEQAPPDSGIAQFYTLLAEHAGTGGG